MKRKKFLIIFGSVCLGIVVLCAVFALVFRLKTVDIEFRSRVVEDKTNLSSDTPTKVLETGEFDFGKNILFMSFDDNIAKIEKSNPYIKVEQIVRHFPNVLRVYISERVPKYRVKDASETNKWYILDNEFKILDKVNTEELIIKKVNGNSNYQDQTIEVTPETLTLTSAIVGEFIEDNIKTYLSNITAGIYGKSQDFTIVKSIEYSEVNHKFTITMRNTSLANDEGCKIELSGIDELYEKALAGAVCFVNGQNIDNVSQRIENTPSVLIKIEKNDDGYYGVVSNV